MNRIKYLVFALVFGVAFICCSQDRQDPLGPGGESGLTEGRLTLGADGPNLMIDSVNVLTACQAIDEEVFTAFVKAGFAKPAGSETAEAVRMMGDYSGYAVVSGSSTLSDTYIAYDIKLEFYDYSEAGSIYIGGALRYIGSKFKIADGWTVRNPRVTGQIKVAGPYTAYFQFNSLLLPTDDQGNLISIFAPNNVLESLIRGGSVSISSGDYTYFQNPYPEPMH